MSQEEIRGITGDSKPEQVKMIHFYMIFKGDFNLTSSGMTFHSDYIYAALRAELNYNPFL